MGVIQVQEPGFFTTVQDLGREGFAPLGVSASGAGDAISLRLGNRLVGNVEGAAGLEMMLLGGTFVFPEGALLALTGSDFGATLDGEPAELWTAFAAKPGQTLRLGPTRSGARCYLCVRGGIAVESFLGSASTHILSGLGGFAGRALRKGDVLDIGSTIGLTQKGKLSARAVKTVEPRKVLRVTPGPQSDWFDEASHRMFYGSTYRVAEDSNRMGLRLEGVAIPMPHDGAWEEETGRNACPTRGGGSMVSEGVALGAIQVPEGGLPIILFVEQQTTGGYPKIANVISADFHSLGQLRPRDEIRFERVAWGTARFLLKEQEELMAAGEFIFE